ncbi:unnamed protein product, partial [Mesorhabditis belari]|uniref:DUF5648 domain-containing protein n=1 Tax=Mesorhabditis belari TaxID=2138241 RepID=A0AAF3FJ88_9BILA
MRDLLFLLLLIALLELASAKWELKPSISISGGWGGKRKSSKSSKSRCPQPPPPPPSLHNCPDPNLPVHASCGSSVGLTPLYRSYNKKIRDHFYTVDPAEQQNAARDGFDIEGQTGFIGTLAPAHCPGMVPLYRMWSNSASAQRPK